MPANTFIATAEAASRIGAVPVFVDVDPDYLLIDPDAVEAAITSRTRAIVPVHLYGQTAPVERDPPDRRGARHRRRRGRRAVPGRVVDGRPRGRLGRVAGNQLLPRQEPRRRRRRGRGHDRRRRGRGVHPQRRRARQLGEVRARPDRHERPAGRRPGAGAARQAPPAGRRGTPPDGPRRTGTPSCSPTSRASGAPLVRPGNEDVWHLYVVQVDERERVMAEMADAGVGVGDPLPDARPPDRGLRGSRLPAGPVPGVGGGGRPHPVAADVPAPDGRAAGACRRGAGARGAGHDGGAIRTTRSPRRASRAFGWSFGNTVASRLGHPGHRHRPRARARARAVRHLRDRDRHAAGDSQLQRAGRQPRRHPLAGRPGHHRADDQHHLRGQQRRC